MCSFAMPWMVCLPLGIRTIKNIGTSAKENIMAKFFKDPDGKLIAALGDDVATPAGCTELTANTEDGRTRSTCLLSRPSVTVT